MKLRIFTLIFFSFLCGGLVLGQQAGNPPSAFNTRGGNHDSCFVMPNGARQYHRGRIEDCGECQPCLSAASTPAGSEGIRSPDGRPILHPQHVAFSHLNWVPNYGEGYGDRMASFPSSTSYVVQSALTRLTPQATWENFAYVFQGGAHIRNPFNAPEFGGQNYGDWYYSQPTAAISYPVPATQSPDVWFVTLTVKPDEIKDFGSAGISVKRSLASWLIGLGGVYLLSEQNNVGGRLGGIAAINISQDIAAYRQLQNTTSATFRVRAQFRNAATGDILTAEGLTPHLFPIISQKGVLFYNSAKMDIDWTDWDSAIRKAMVGVKTDFDVRFRNWRRGRTDERRLLLLTEGSKEQLEWAVDDLAKFEALVKEVAELKKRRAAQREALGLKEPDEQKPPQEKQPEKKK